MDPRTGDDANYILDENTYTIQDVAEKAKRFLYDECYLREYPGGVPHYYLGYRVCGYSANAALPEAWEIRIVEESCFGLERLYEDDQFGPRWAGETEALDRLVLGMGSKTEEALVNLGLQKDIAQKTMLELIKLLYANLYLPAMPIQDAIDLAYFLADTAARFAQFSLRAATVGGPIEVATITKHEGFKWVRRKHYYSAEFNPREVT
jgi:hypothetical protein